MPRRLLFLLALATFALGSGLAAQKADLDGLGYTLGDPEAPVEVVEYADFACSACGTFAKDTWPEVRRRYVETGLVRWRFVPFELGFRNSDEGARAGECAADQGAFWEVHDLLFEAQDGWIGARRPKDALFRLAGSVGVDMEVFERCYEDDLGRDRTRANNRAARTDRVRGTPTFFINGFRVQGALPIEAFQAILDESALAPGR